MRSIRLLCRLLMRTVWASLVGACMAAAPVAIAGDGVASRLGQLDLADLLDIDIQTASRFSQKRSEEPSSVTVIMADEIRAHGYERLSEILNSVRGLYAYTDRLYEFAGVRGFGRPEDYNSRMLLLIDGIRMNEPVYGQGSLGTEFPLDVELIERVEFVPGPGSAVYGNNAMFGVINVITRKGSDLRGTELAAATGNRHTASGRASYGRQFENGADLLLSASSFGTRGESLHHPGLEALGAPGGTVRGMDYNRSESAFGRLTFEHLKFEIGYSSRKKGIPNAVFGTIPGDSQSYMVDAQGFAALGYERELAPGLEMALRTTYGAYDYDGNLPFDVDGATAYSDDMARSRWWTAEAKFVWRGWQGHRLVFGSEYRRDQRADQYSADRAPRVVNLDSHVSGQTWGAYAQDDIALTERLTLGLGMRFDHDSHAGSVASPRISLIHQPDSKRSVKLLYGSAYRAPNAYEMYYAFPGAQKGNTRLEPEKVDTWEVAYEQFLGDRLRMTASAYSYLMKHLISQETDPLDGVAQFRNASEVRARGLELEVERVWDQGGRVRASYALQRAELAGDGRLSNSPQHLFKLIGTAPLPVAGLRLSGELFGVSSRRTAVGTLGSYAVANLNLNWRVTGQGLEFSLGVQNLFDRDFSVPASQDYVGLGIDTMPQLGRNVRLRAKWSF